MNQYENNFSENFHVLNLILREVGLIFIHHRIQQSISIFVVEEIKLNQGLYTFS